MFTSSALHIVKYRLRLFYESLILCCRCSFQTICKVFYASVRQEMSVIRWPGLSIKVKPYYVAVAFHAILPYFIHSRSWQAFAYIQRHQCEIRSLDVQVIWPSHFDCRFSITRSSSSVALSNSRPFASVILSNSSRWPLKSPHNQQLVALPENSDVMT